MNKRNLLPIKVPTFWWVIISISLFPLRHCSLLFASAFLLDLFPILRFIIFICKEISIYLLECMQPSIWILALSLSLSIAPSHSHTITYSHNALLYLSVLLLSSILIFGAQWNRWNSIKLQMTLQVHNKHMILLQNLLKFKDTYSVLFLFSGAKRGWTPPPAFHT